jgi:hypothetical protein
MESSSTGQKAFVVATAFGVIPCVVGVGIGQFLRWNDVVWLTDAGGFWPIVFFGASLAVLLKRVVSPFEDRTSCVVAWLVVAWTWLYFPLWLTATEVPQSSAVISRDGRVFVASDSARHPTSKVWLLTNRAGTRIVHNVAGTVMVNAVEARYRFAEPYIATRNNEEDVSKPLISAVHAALAAEAGQSRSSRIALFERREVHDQLLDKICRTVALGSPTCPLKLKLSPQSEATALGAVWSKHYTEKEAVEERHLPTLVQLLTHENAQLADRDQVFLLFVELAVTVDDLAKVARKPRMLSDYQLDELIRRIVATSGGGDEVVRILAEGNRLKQEQRRELRAKMFRDASIELIAKHATPLRISDSEIAQLAARMRAAFETSPDVALLVMETFGERLPPEVQQDAVSAIVSAKAPYALAALQRLSCSGPLREKLLHKVLTDANYDDFDAARLSREKLEDVLAPAEMRSLIASVIRKSESSAKWLSFAVRALPLRGLTIAERKTILNGLLFENAKSAFEFVSENRQYFEAADVNEITYDYTKTITHDVCLHLSHRNRNRRVDFFSEAQLEILRNCAESK